MENKKYKGFEIGFSERSGNWELMQEGKVINESEKYKEVISYADAFRKKEFKRMKAWKMYGSNIEKVEITSVVVGYDGRDDIWISSKEHGRSKLKRYEDLFKDTLKNREVINVINNRVEQISELEKLNQDNMEKLEKITGKDLGVKTEEPA